MTDRVLTQNEIDSIIEEIAKRLKDEDAPSNTLKQAFMGIERDKILSQDEINTIVEDLTRTLKESSIYADIIKDLSKDRVLTQSEIDNLIREIIANLHIGS